MKKFDSSAWSGRSAHRQAVKSGKAVVPALIAAVFERNRPAHSRMWLATALADIRDERAAEALIKLLHDGLSGVRQVAAYGTNRLHSLQIKPGTWFTLCMMHRRKERGLCLGKKRVLWKNV